MDPIITDDTVVDSMRSFVKGVIDELDLNVGFHDFRVVIGETHTNLIFDIVVPFEIKNADDLKDEISKRIHSLHNDYYAVITVDRA
jgi:divalent metal cation (Fe/Co/Zn/Cd) transporter